ncbi:MAG: hypothetical protein GX591_17925 [Planctomycetes bacterium]|nr:hypothetical protein [Planctomycetota bacterium]
MVTATVQYPLRNTPCSGRLAPLAAQTVVGRLPGNWRFLVGCWVFAVTAFAAPPPPPSSQPSPSDPRAAELRLIYFPPHRFGPIRTVAAGGLTVLTDAEKPDDAALRAHLAALEGILDALPLAPATQPASQPGTQPAATAVTAALYARQDAFGALWHRVGVYYDGRFLGARGAGGYSYRPFCATYLDAARPDAIPPELAHEMAHVWLWSHAGLPNDGNWLSEGLATAVQLQLFPSLGERRAWAERVRAGKFVPLKRLMDTAPLEGRHYWQAATLVEMLLADHRDALPAVLDAVTDGRDPNAIVTEVLGLTWLAVERQWRAHVAAAGAPEPSTRQ